MQLKPNPKNEYDRKKLHKAISHLDIAAISLFEAEQLLNVNWFKPRQQLNNKIIELKLILAKAFNDQK